MILTLTKSNQRVLNEEECSQAIAYKLITTAEMVDDIGLVEAYGIESFITSPRSESKYNHIKISNISCCKNVVCNIISFLNDAQVFPIHMEDVITDMLGVYE